MNLTLGDESVGKLRSNFPTIIISSREVVEADGASVVGSPQECSTCGLSSVVNGQAASRWTEDSATEKHNSNTCGVVRPASLCQVVCC